MRATFLVLFIVVLAAVSVSAPIAAGEHEAEVLIDCLQADLAELIASIEEKNRQDLILRCSPIQWGLPVGCAFSVIECVSAVACKLNYNGQSGSRGSLGVLVAELPPMVDIGHLTQGWTVWDCLLDDRGIDSGLSFAAISAGSWEGDYSSLTWNGYEFIAFPWTTPSHDVAYAAALTYAKTNYATVPATTGSFCVNLDPFGLTGLAPACGTVAGGVWGGLTWDFEYEGAVTYSVGTLDIAVPVSGRAIGLPL